MWRDELPRRFAFGCIPQARQQVALGIVDADA